MCFGEELELDLIKLTMCFGEELDLIKLMMCFSEELDLIKLTMCVWRRAGPYKT